MVSFLVKESRETRESRLEVETQTPEDKSGDSDLRPGLHRFMLVVENEAGVQSEPAIVEVEVTEPISRFSPTFRDPGAIDDAGLSKTVPAASPAELRSMKKSRKGKSKEGTKSQNRPKAKKTAPKR